MSYQELFLALINMACGGEGRVYNNLISLHCVIITQISEMAVRVVCDIACTQEYPQSLEHYNTVVCILNQILASPTGFFICDFGL